MKILGKNEIVDYVANIICFLFRSRKRFGNTDSQTGIN